MTPHKNRRFDYYTSSLPPRGENYPQSAARPFAQFSPNKRKFTPPQYWRGRGGGRKTQTYDDRSVASCSNAYNLKEPSYYYCEICPTRYTNSTQTALLNAIFLSSSTNPYPPLPQLLPVQPSPKTAGAGAQHGTHSCCMTAHARHPPSHVMETLQTRAPSLFWTNTHQTFPFPPPPPLPRLWPLNPNPNLQRKPIIIIGSWRGGLPPPQLTPLPTLSFASSGINRNKNVGRVNSQAQPVTPSDLNACPHAPGSRWKSPKSALYPATVSVCPPHKNVLIDRPTTRSKNPKITLF